jgi:hypothetical protein
MNFMGAHSSGIGAISLPLIPTLFVIFLTGLLVGVALWRMRGRR